MRWMGYFFALKADFILMLLTFAIILPTAISGRMNILHAIMKLTDFLFVIQQIRQYHLKKFAIFLMIVSMVLMKNIAV